MLRTPIASTPSCGPAKVAGSRSKTRNIGGCLPCAGRRPGRRALVEICALMDPPGAPLRALSKSGPAGGTQLRKSGGPELRKSGGPQPRKLGGPQPRKFCTRKSPRNPQARQRPDKLWAPNESRRHWRATWAPTECRFWSGRVFLSQSRYIEFGVPPLFQGLCYGE